VDLTGDDFPLESLVGAEATSSGVSPSAVVRATDPDCVMEEREDPERTESPEQRKAKKGVNLRKSLAWDSEFFTSEGSSSLLFFPGPHPCETLSVFWNYCLSLYTLVNLNYAD
jgi:hypothetical protein